jgi:hypothetical protein
VETRKYCSRAYWSNCIDTIISSIKDDKDVIIDMLMFGNLQDAEIIMKLLPDKSATYEFKVNKIPRVSPFGEYIDE